MILFLFVMVFGVMREGFLGSGMDCRIGSIDSGTSWGGLFSTFDTAAGSCRKCDNGYTTLERGRGVCT